MENIGEEFVRTQPSYITIFCGKNTALNNYFPPKYLGSRWHFSMSALSSKGISSWTGSATISFVLIFIIPESKEGVFQVRNNQGYYAYTAFV